MLLVALGCANAIPKLAAIALNEPLLSRRLVAQSGAILVGDGIACNFVCDYGGIAAGVRDLTTFVSSIKSSGMALTRQDRKSSRTARG